MRLNTYLARAGVTSRRKADELIKTGQVLLNGKRANLDDQATKSDEVIVEGKKISAQKPRYILLNKPPGAVTTLKDPQGRSTVADLIKIPERIVPVGRLDYDTTGALLLTNDGQLAHKLMHPGFEVDKTYKVTVKGSITPQLLNMLSNGVKLEDGMTAPAKAEKLSDNKIELTIHEGKKRQVKRMVAAVGLEFISLERTKYGPLDLNGLTRGQWRDLSAAEISQLKML